MSLDEVHVSTQFWVLDLVFADTTPCGELAELPACKSLLSQGPNTSICRKMFPCHGGGNDDDDDRANGARYDDF